MLIVFNLYYLFPCWTPVYLMISIPETRCQKHQIANKQAVKFLCSMVRSKLFLRVNVDVRTKWAILTLQFWLSKKTSCGWCNTCYCGNKLLVLFNWSFLPHTNLKHLNRFCLFYSVESCLKLILLRCATDVLSHWCYIWYENVIPVPFDPLSPPSESLP